ncbi:chemotaxis protein CheW [Microvirga subterranea]|uniref:Purine-binding chemotaxis protein CheW n=1 Tax=Microvirga subterranea TaxID=186651 RepID=A0A370HVZ4_9HYPH|nr:chemotaxis protein CheW [Microvirga subterranea]RDI62615.1 purine-binding chemotaxis protein CheW [Microvirga subterranea]
MSRRRKLRQITRSTIMSAEERARHLLDERTERLARRSGKAEEAAATVRVLVCSVGPEYYGLPLEGVAEVLAFRIPMPVPGGPAGLVGVLGRSGHLVSVVDLGAAVGQASAASDVEAENQHVVLLRREQPRVALRVDRALGVEDVLPLTAEDAREFRMEAVVGYAKSELGFADQDRVLSLLDIDRLLRPFLTPSPASGV